MIVIYNCLICLIYLTLVDGEFYILAKDENVQLCESFLLQVFDDYKPYVRHFTKRIGELVEEQNEDISPLKRMKIIWKKFLVIYLFDI